MVKAGSKDELDLYSASALHTSSKKSLERFAPLVGRSTEEDDAHTQSGFSDSSDDLSSDKEESYGSENDEDDIA